MLIIQAGTPDYREMMDETRRRCEQWGYRYVRYDLQPDEADLGGNLPPCTFKPKMMEGIPINGEITAWLDADAIPLKPLEEPLREFQMFDVAVTLRDAEDIGKSQPTTGYLNAGVVFFQGLRAAWFIEKWQKLTDEIGNDQAALNEMVGRDWSDEDWRLSFGKLAKTPDGYYVRILSARRWNFFTFDRGRPGPDVKILHFKRGWRQLNGPNWWREYLAAC